MKKNEYLKPEMEVVEIQTQSMIAASNQWGNQGGELEIDDDDTIDPL